MNWSSDINNLFSNYKLNRSKDYNGDGKVDEKDKKLLFEKTDLFKTSEVSYEDLVQLSTKKDADNDGNVSDDEKSFFSDLKNFLYEKIAQNINKDNELSVDDMLELEKTVRNLNSTQKEDIGSEMEKIQNRMVSNLTSQYFVSIETDEYKASAKDRAEEVWNAQVELDSLNEKSNNPFNAKFENLLDKLEKRVEKTLAETFTSAQIKEMEEKIKGSEPETPVNPPSTGDYTPALKGEGFEEVESNNDHKKYLFKDGELYSGLHADIYYKDGELYSGLHADIYYIDGRAGTGICPDNNLYYEQGLVKDGISELSGKYYDHGKSITGDIDYNGGILHVENSEIKYFEKRNENGDTVRTDYIKYAHKDSNGNSVATSYSKITTFNGTNKDRIKTVENYSTDGKNEKISTQTYTYNADGSYTVVTEFEDGSESVTDKYDVDGVKYTGNGVWNGHFYKDGVISAGQDSNGRWYNDYGIKIEGEYQGVLYNDGFKFTGINENDNLYYSDGTVKPWAVDENSNIAYANGYPAQGAYKGDNDNAGKYYENGVVKEAPQGIIDFALAYNVQGIRIQTINGVTTFTGKDVLNANVVDVKFTDLEYNSGELVKFSRTIDYHSEVSQTDKFEKGNNGFILKSVVVTLKGATEDKEINLEIDNAKEQDSFDYSVMFADIDDMLLNGVNIAQALNDNVTLISNYKKDSLGNYTDDKKTETIIFGSIKDIQNGNDLHAFTLSDEVTYKNENNSFIVTDKSVNGVEMELNYGEDGIFVSGKIKFEDSETEITLTQGDSFKINEQTNEIIVYNKQNNNITTYENTGSVKGEVVNITPELEAFVSDLNLDILLIGKFTIADEKIATIEIGGINYTVTHETDKIKLSNDEEHLETVFSKITAEDNSESYVITLKKEKVENGFKVSNWDINGNELSVEIQDTNGIMISKTEYDNAHKVKSVTTYNAETKTYEKKEYDSNNNVIKTTVTKEDGAKTIQTVYRGVRYPDEARNSRITETVTEGNTVSVSTFNDDNEKFQTDVTENNILKERWIYNYSSSKKLLNITINIYSADGSEVSKVKTLNNNGSYSIKEGETTLYYTRSGKQLTNEQLNWANNLGLLIEDIEYDNNEIVSITGQRYDNKNAVYTNFSKDNNNKYSYTETLTLSNNATPDVADDIVLVTVIDKNEQKSATFTIDGKTYAINIDGAKIFDTLDNAISTWEAGDLAHKAVVSDVIFDGVSRKRIFKKSAEHYDVVEILALASIEDLNKNEKSFISFEAAKFEQGENSITITPDSNNKITVNYGTYLQNDNSGHKAGDYKKAYEIVLPENATLIISKTDQGYEIKDSANNVYTFTENGGYTVTKDGVTTSYDNSGNLVQNSETPSSNDNTETPTNADSTNDTDNTDDIENDSDDNDGND